MVKKGVDVVLGSALALLALPVILIFAVGLAVALRCNPFFFQYRVGKDGRDFTFVKLRTLPRQFPMYADKFAIGDTQIPTFAKLLRRLHLDELPQLFLVPLGRMSLVGPRPEMRVLHGQMDPVFAAERVTIRPGCTGLWQIGKHQAGLIAEAPLYDRFYIQNQNLRLDLWILARTASLLVGRGSIVSIEDVPAWVLPRRATTTKPAPVPVPELEVGS